MEELKDLKAKETPYVVIFHLGLDDDIKPADKSINNAFWGEGDKKKFYDAVKDYPPLCIFHGHKHLNPKPNTDPEYRKYLWPSEESKYYEPDKAQIQVYNVAGNTDKPCYWIVKIDAEKKTLIFPEHPIT